MKTIKTFTLLASVCATALLAVGCDKTDNSGISDRRAVSVKEGRFDINEDEFATMRMSPEDVFVNSSMKLIIENKTKGKLVYGAPFSLEYFDKENWTKIQFAEDFQFVALGYTLKANETQEGQFNIQEDYFSKLGRYRIVKRFTYFSNFFANEEDNSEEPVIVDFTLYAEFEIK